MRAPVRLGLYGLVLVVVFGVAAVTANAVVPDEAARSWAQQTDKPSHHPAGDAKQDAAEAASPLGLGIEQDSYRLTGVSAPRRTGSDGELSLVVTGPDGKPVQKFEVEHEKELHLIVVRSDGQHFRHVHPRRAADGTWSIPWRWTAAGSYRVFADFTPAKAGKGVTLSTSVQVSGRYAPVPSKPTRKVSVDGFDVAVQGKLTAGRASELTLSVTRDGRPVRTLEPYLGAFGHLVALREGDLAYLHVHPHGDVPKAGARSGPEIVFEASAPTPGRYLLYLDFKVDGQVHSAPLVLDTTGLTPEKPEKPEKHKEDGGHDHGE